MNTEEFNQINVYKRYLVDHEKVVLDQVLRVALGNESKAAQLLGVSRGALRKKLKLYQFNRNGYKTTTKTFPAIDKQLHITQQSLGNTLKTLLVEADINESELARRTSIGQPIINKLCRGENLNPKIETLKTIAQFFGVSVSRLIGDEAPRNSNSLNLNGASWQHLPLIDWDGIKDWHNQSKPIFYKQTITTDLSLSEYGYALKVNDTTMEPRFSAGSVLVVDPTRSFLRDQAYVIILIHGQTMPLFRQIISDGNAFYLKALNPDFKTVVLEENYQVLGTVVQVKMDF